MIALDAIKIKKIVQEYRLLIDTGALMHEKSDIFFSRELGPVLMECNKKLIVPTRVEEEIRSLETHLECIPSAGH